MIKLIIFDLWQTLIYRDVGYSTTSEMLKQTGIDIPKQEMVKLFESSIQKKKWESKEEAYKNLCKEMLRRDRNKNNKLDLDKTTSLLMQIRDNAEKEVKTYPHAIPMLKNLKEQGYITGLISNSSIFAVELVKKETEILYYIDYKLFSFNAGTIKPDFKIYKKMLEITNTKPNEAIMIGDNKEDDVDPPRKLGMNAILYTNLDKLKEDLKAHGIYLEI